MKQFETNSYLEAIGQSVDAEWLNDFLGASKPIGVWVTTQIKNNELVEGVDYVRKRIPTVNGGTSVAWMISMEAACMIAMSDRGPVGRSARREYAASVAQAFTAKEDLKPKEGARPKKRKPIMIIAKADEQRAPERVPAIMLKASESTLPNEDMALLHFLRDYVFAGHNSMLSFIGALFNLGYVDHAGWPVDVFDWLYENDGKLYINPAKSKAHLRYRPAMV